MVDRENIVERLRSIEEELRDLAYELLRAAAAGHDDGAEREERKVQQARRGVEKAIRALSPSRDGSVDWG
ncbi:MAG TPA: hypothetical protein VHP57_07615 [Acidimicrobiia bacterium]|jgi:hypothetical protein|nr:hypothetical protein [Acidimicrobiia bacterium]